MNKPIVFLFTGQGAQYFKMAGELMETHPVFEKWMKYLDEILQEKLKDSLIRKIYRGKGTFDHLAWSHPAIFAVEYALAQTLISEGIFPDYLLGISLGEYTAAAVSKVMSPEVALDLLVDQANIVTETCKEGKMIAVLGPLRIFNEDTFLHENSELAIVNHEQHFTISVPADNVTGIEKRLKRKAVLFSKLPVNYGFHSSLVEPAKPAYHAFLNKVTCKKPETRIVSALRATMLDEVSPLHFWNVIRETIHFDKSVQYIEKAGPHCYIDAGPSGSMKTILEKIIDSNRTLECFPVISPFGKENVNIKKIKSHLESQKPKNKTHKNISNMKAYLFPGQGSQKVGMGGELFDQYKDLTSKADEVLGYSIKELCLVDAAQKIDFTDFTQPALYVVNAFSYLKYMEENGKPDYTAGHSLGEYNALFAAGAFDFETGLKLVKKRGELMAKAKNGGMAAVIGLDEEKIKDVINKENLEIDVANYNSTDQIIISGLKDTILKSEPVFKKAGAKVYIPLKVTGAFHSRYMVNAAEEFGEFINGFTFNTLQAPVIANVTARPYIDNAVHTNLKNQIFYPVKWLESVRYMMGKNVIEFKEIGPGDVLTKLAAKIRTQEKPLIVEEHNDKPGKVAEKKVFTGKKRIGKISGNLDIKPEKLGSQEFKDDYHLRYAYVSGAMYRGIASPELVIKMANAGFLSFFGTGGLSLHEIEDAITVIQKSVKGDKPYGMNLLSNLYNPRMEDQTVDLYLTYGINKIEAAAYLQVTPALVRYRLRGLKNENGKVTIGNKVIAKVSRVEIASQFLSPAPEKIVKKLLVEGAITEEQARLSQNIPLCDDICAEADSAGHTDMAVATSLIPAMMKLRDDYMEKYGYAKKVRVGAAGGIGTPESAASAFILGADFIVTGSINQCTVEASTSDMVKDLLQDMNVHDTAYVPAGDMFEMGAKVQVLRRGLFFPSRANKLYEIYKHYNSLEELDDKTKTQLQEKYFKRSFDDIYGETKAYFRENDPSLIEKAEKNPKYKMALIFRWYFHHTTKLALIGDKDQKLDYQVHCGPALGAFNEWVKGSEYENWKNRHVDEIATLIMNETANILIERINSFAVMN